MPDWVPSTREACARITAPRCILTLTWSRGARIDFFLPVDRLGLGATAFGSFFVRTAAASSSRCYACQD